jgi:hypothetical protein
VLAFQFRATECAVAVTPAPASVIVVGEPVALLVAVTAPLSFPTALGVKITLNERFCPGVSVTGVLAPFKANPVPLSTICEIVTFAFPVLVTVTLSVDCDPVFTFPKLRDVELKERRCVAVIPVPLRAMVRGEPGALLAILTLPRSVPAEAGAN